MTATVRSLLLPTVACGLTLALGVAVSCSDSSSNGSAAEENLPETTGFSRQQLLVDVGRCASGNYQIFLGSAKTLTQAVQQYAGSLTDEDRDAAQAAFRLAMADWQRAELYQFGPAGRMSQVAGGEDLRDAIYSFNQDLIGGGTSACRVDQELVDKAYEGDLSQLATSRRGLDALEYLLFAPGAGNACSSANALNTSGAWSALSEDEIGERRASYALAVAQDVQSNAEALTQAWSESGGNFLEELRTAGNGSQVYSSQRDALDNIATFIVVLENGVKDMKLAEPLGLAGACPTGTAGEACPAELESSFAGFGKSAVASNLEAALQLFKGCAAVPVQDGEPAADAELGFVAYLEAVGEEETAREIVTDLEAAQAALQALDSPSLAQAIENERASVVEVHEPMARVSRTLKSTFLTVLDIQVPQSIPADND